MSGAVFPNGGTSSPQVSRIFGYRDKIYADGIHKGLDTVGYVYNCAPENGTIISARYNGQQGNEILIQGDSGKIHRLSHHKSFIRTSGRVSKGERVGVQGATGLATGVHCHWEVRTGSSTGSYQDPTAWVRVMNATPAAIGTGQRRTLPSNGTVTRRGDPSTKNPHLPNPLAPNEVGNFTGWIYGENVNGNNVWFQGTSGNWFWSGAFVGGADTSGLTNLNPSILLPNQRIVGKDGVRRRSQPTTQVAESMEMLAPGSIGTFAGWIYGEEVAGNNVWYKGLLGDYSWSGGYEGGANGTGLEDLNPKPPVLAATQRKALADVPANRRGDPSTKNATVGAPLPGGAVGDFIAWAHGESVAGIDVWFQGTSGDWFWSGGFEGGAITTGLPEKILTTPAPEPEPEVPQPSPAQRIVSDRGAANGRTGPGTMFPNTASLASGTVETLDGWTEGEQVTQAGITSKVWFRKGLTWFWAGGFTSQATEGITRVEFTGELPTRTPFYPRATVAYNTPNGGVLKNGVRVADRPAGGDKIRRLWIHHTGTTADQVAYFMTMNDRKSCPTWYVRRDGTTIEFIRPKLRPWSTGEEADKDGLAIETQNVTGGDAWGITPESHEAIAQIAAWMAQQTEIDGLPVEFTIDAEHIKGHRDAPGAATACPGPSMNIPWIIARAKEIVAAAQPQPEPEPEPEEPEDFPADLKNKWVEFRDAMDEYLN